MISIIWTIGMNGMMILTIRKKGIFELKKLNLNFFID